MFDLEEKICPYPGLRPFTEDEAIYFKGRDRHVELLSKMLEENKFLMVTGASGDGKSSLIYAGLIPNMTAGFFHAQHNQWKKVSFRPERNPIHQLSQALAEGLGYENVQTVRTHLGYGYSAIVDLFNNAPLNKPNPDKKQKPFNLLILVDQLEELFTYAENFHKGKVSYSASILINLLCETNRIAKEENLPIYIVCTMRSDFIGQCSHFHGLPELIGKSHYFVPRLDRKDFIQVIEEPAILSGNEITQRLIERLVFDLREGMDLLPVLQHALFQIWTIAKDDESDKMDLIHYAKAGGMPYKELSESDQHIFLDWFNTLPATYQALYFNPSFDNVLNIHANKLYETAFEEISPPIANLTKDECQWIIELTFRCLTRIDEGRTVRNSMSLAELTNLIGNGKYDHNTINSVLNIFRKQGNTLLYPFINENPDSLILNKNTILDITHEALIRNWEKLAEWTAKETESIQIFQDLNAQLERWIKNKKSPQFLLQKGSCFYFESWYNEKLPNPIWIKRYLKNELQAETGEQAQRLYSNNRNGNSGNDRSNTWKEELNLSTKQLARKQAILKVGKKGDAEMLYSLISKFLILSKKNINKGRFLKTLSGVVAGICIIAIAAVIYVTKLNQTISQNSVQILRTRHATELATRAYQSLDKDPTLAFRLAEQATSIEETPLARQVLSAAYAKSPFYSILKGHIKPVTAIIFSPNGQDFLSASDDRTLRLWNLKTENIAIFEGHTKGFYPRSNEIIKFSKDGKNILSGSLDGTARLWNIEGKCLQTLNGHENTITSVQFIETNDRFLTASFDMTAKLWNKEGMCLTTFHNKSRVFKAIYSEKFKQVITASHDGLVTIFDLNGNIINKRSAHTEPITGFILSKDETTLISMGMDSLINIHDLKSNKIIKIQDVFAAGIANNVLDINPSNDLIVACLEDEQLALYDFTGKKIISFHPKLSTIWAVHFSPDGKNIIACGDKENIKMFDLKGQEIERLNGHSGQVFTSRFSGSGDYVVSASGDNTLRLWNINPVEKPRLFAHRANITSISVDHANNITSSGLDHLANTWNAQGRLIAKIYHPDYFVSNTYFLQTKNQIMTCNSSAGIFRWDHEGKLVHHYKSPSKHVSYFLSFSHDSTYFISNSSESHAQLWSIDGKTLINLFGLYNARFSPDSKIIAGVKHNTNIALFHFNEILANKSIPDEVSFVAHSGNINDLQFSSDSKRLISASDDSTVAVWDFTGKLQLKLPKHSGSISKCIISDNARYMLTICTDNIGRVWDFEGKKICTLIGHLKQITDATFSASSDKILTSSLDNLVKLWNLKGTLLETYAGHQGGVMHVNFSHDDQYVISASNDQTVLVVPISTEDVLNKINVAKVRGEVWSFSEVERKNFGVQ